jgi:hypothetical protein
MSATTSTSPEELAALRKRTGADRWDEMWNGVLHMPPSPNRYHQDFEFALHQWLQLHWAPLSGGRVHHQINIAPRTGDWTKNYRIPDLVLLTPDRFGIDRIEYFAGAPAAVVEIHSPGDEAYEKLEFYAQLGVPEAWIIERDSKRPEIYALSGAKYELTKTDPEGWTTSVVIGVRMKETGDGRLRIRLADVDASQQDIP